MTFALFTHVPHILKQNAYFAYAPYVREMNIWSKYCDQLIIVAPISTAPISTIDMPYDHNCIDFEAISDLNVLNLKNFFSILIQLPKISWKIFKVISKNYFQYFLNSFGIFKKSESSF